MSAVQGDLEELRYIAHMLYKASIKRLHLDPLFNYIYKRVSGGGW